MKLRDKLDRLTFGSAVPRPAQPERSEPSTPSDAALAEEIVLRRARIADLRGRLAALQRGPSRPVEPGPRVPWYDSEQPGRPRGPVDATLPGEVVQGPHGPLCRRITDHAEDHRHGAAEVARARAVSGEDVALLSLDPALAEVDFGRALYLDTETTGLAGGAGTLPFLIGMAWFEGARLRVEQLMLPRPGAELPLLARLRERLREASVIVSYNGKSFDWPLLRTRYILNRLAAPTLPAHLDLLHCARRVFRARLGSARLACMEQELLGFERVDDIPGELIPERYLAFVRGHAAGASLLPILEHNLSDLVALPALLGDMLRRLDDCARQDARDQLGFARVLSRGAAAARAIELAQRAADADARGELAAVALQMAGELELRRGELAAAIRAFERAVEASADPRDAARAHLALAKLHERRTKRLEDALRHARATVACEGAEASARRVARLTARLARRPRADATA